MTNDQGLLTKDFWLRTLWPVDGPWITKDFWQRTVWPITGLKMTDL